MSGLFALVDCNNFYASCERLFQPALRGKPVVVLSNNDGCVIARSNEAKALGIGMGEPWHLFHARYAEQGVIVRSSNYTLYGDLSVRVMSVLGRFAPHLEIYSIDEAFLSLEGFEASLEDHARTIRRTVLQFTGIPVSVGVAPTKLLAKVANRLAKKDLTADGVRLLLDEASQEAALAGFELTDLWGVAGRMAARLVAEGIRTPLELRAAEPAYLRERFGIVMQRIGLELRGTSCLPLEEATPDRKSIVSSRSFGRPITVDAEMREAVATYMTRAAEKMRRQKLATAQIVVFLETNSFKPGDPQYRAQRPMQLPVATADAGKLIAAAMACLAEIWRPGYRYKKAGVMLLALTPAADVQAGLFDRPDDPRSLARMKAMDSLNGRFGRGTVTYAAAGKRPAWTLRSDHLSAPSFVRS